MKLLFIHQNFPAQFKNLAPALAKDKHNQVMVISQNPHKEIAGITSYRYTLKTNPSDNVPPLLREEHVKILRAEAVLELAKKIRDKGFYPDMIYVHPGWGEGVYLKDVWPNSYMIGYFEYFYRMKGQDFDFDVEFPVTEDQKRRLRLKNNVNYQALDNFDAGVSPTYWQRATYPKWAQKKITVLADGIDTEVCKPEPGESIRLARHDLMLSSCDQILTFSTRYLEPLRGFHVFMRVLPQLLKKYPGLHILIVGSEDSGYGAKLPQGQSYKKNLLAELSDQLDPSRVHFLGRLPYKEYLKVLQISTVHYYASYPFVISWSLLEAMSCGCAIVASNTEPVREFIKHKDTGLLFNFFNQESLLKQLIHLLDNKKLRDKISKKARLKIIEEYNLHSCLEKQLAFIKPRFIS